MKETIAKITVLPMILHRLTEIAKQLKRIADLYAMDLRSRDLYEGSPEVGDDADPEVYYRDEMRELAEEIAEARKKQMG
jgi:hypothetical protein